ncbi:MAG: TetR/AcrR family transcriptional regulator, partial [Anaeroplasmataceae bacterium]|nr:TetR/AcrR family transcriptional regulator [Anaeroplasmataceae bacterium]
MNRSESKFQNTANKMGSAFITLLETKEFLDITIMDICKAAGVNRSTFYAHYDNTSLLYTSPSPRDYGEAARTGGGANKR